ncbi:glycosyltransferase family 4 protein [Phenylobacterium sp.]|uniref:glycosyltransferase family 4 protein n=1 Tax=Phenylobacterium sp. TaxID=1871053 RepID=UPI002810B29C|nr:glycosyltransferase family 4 protein [Phenylobacterium sp.]
MKVGIVTTWFERGAGVVSRQIADALTSAGMEIFIYARGERYAVGDPKWDLPNVRWAKRLHWSGSGKIDRSDFDDWISSCKLEVIIFNEQRWWQPIIWAKDRGVTCGAYIDYYTRESVSLFSIYDFLICNTQRHYEAFRWHPGASYVPWGTEVDLFKPRPKKNGRLRFFHSCGWDTARKGTDLVIAAFNQIRADVDAELIIHSQIDLSGSICEDDRITVKVGTVPAPGLYHLGDFYVYPSRLEGIGLTICEALAVGLPVITTDEGPMSEFVLPGRTGYLVPVARRFVRGDNYYWPMAEVSVPDLAAAMRRACALSRSEVEMMQSAARGYAVESRSWRENSKALPAIVAGSMFSKPSVETVASVNRFDYAGVKGKLDYLLEVPPLRAVGSAIFRIYREHRQPHIYAATSASPSARPVK